LPTTTKIYGTLLPDDQLYKLFIDLPSQHLGEDAFEGEPGYKVAMKQALHYMEDTLMTRLDATGLVKLRNSCVRNVLRRNRKSSNLTRFGMGFAPGYSYNISRLRVRAMSPQAILEFNQLVTPYTTEQAARLLLNETKYISMFSLLADRNETIIPNTLPLPTRRNISAIKIHSGFRSLDQLPRVKLIIDNYLESYYNSTAMAQTDSEKVKAIAKLIRSIDLFHVFPDGNTRTLVFIVLPKLLRENGISHGVIVGYPNFDIGVFSVQEMVTQIWEGIETFYNEFPMLQPPKAAYT
jgi:hypothetical protein